MNRSVLVTGGNRGLGLAIATRHAKAGERVAVTYRTEPPAGDFLAVQCDVTDPDSVEAAVTTVEAQQGPVEVLVANAGITQDGLALRMTDEQFAATLETNLVGAFRVARRTLRGMLSARTGRIIFISSVNALSGAAGQANYAASKAGLIGMARSLARELGPRGITANVVAPGYAHTDMTSALSGAVLEDVVSRIPLRRLAEPEEVAAVVEFLTSADAAYVTGAVVPVDGGLGMGH